MQFFSGIDVSCSKAGDASLENLESENVRVRTQQGNCSLKSIKVMHERSVFPLNSNNCFYHFFKVSNYSDHTYKLTMH